MYNSNIISIKNLNKYYNSKKILDNLNLNIPKGKINIILGSNGAGKSTLIKTLSGITKSFQGEIKIDGIDINNLEINKKIGYMSQVDSLYDDLCVIDNIKFFADINKIKNSKEKIQKLIKFVELLNFENVKVKNLSGGMKKRLSLACTLINDPEIIILDEPTTALDIDIKNKIWHILKNLTKLGKTVIVTTHILDEIFFCDNIFFLKNGKIEKSYSKQDFIDLRKTKINIINKNYSKSLITDNSNITQILHENGLNKNIIKINIEKEDLLEIVSKMINS